MKLTKLFIFSFILIAFSACTVRTGSKDIVKGTPTNADSVLPAQKHHLWSEAEMEAFRESLPRVYNR
ncbi:MAG TPA: hypothetical protein PLM81_07105 [Ginsengibacter sp.]|nr:hypothetical protein [Chitinophagaceae bacterium]MCZ2395676.1 hypothetical protein [Chitinophagales bacterium]HRN72877.1 hypothetical protein [Ginsengibacter sp.]MCO5285547.1 hypothetical protein [Chitinophagaceae bacterium]MCW5913571.1 hypothetical protein [Chitinophagaceae bacterium]